MRSKPAPLQCRLAATVHATFLTCALVLCNFRSANAADLASLVVENQNHLIPDGGGLGVTFPFGSYNGLEIRDGPDESEGAGLLDLVSRASSATETTSLGNNQFQEGTIKIGDTQWFYFPKNELDDKKSSVTTPSFPAFIPESTTTDGSGSQIDLRKRSTPLYISLTACSKPSLNTTDTEADSALQQLRVYISQKVQRPGPNEDSSSQTEYDVQQGYMNATVQADGDVYIGVSAPNMTAYSGSWTYELGASIDSYFHEADIDDPFLFFIDSDINAALLTTNNLTYAAPGSENWKQWMNITPPFTMFANNINDTSISGLERSYCALDSLAQIGQGDTGIEVGMTSRGLGNYPKEEFFLTGLNRSSEYIGILARDGNSTKSGNRVVGGGGKVYKPMNFMSKTDDNCAVLYNLSFCNQVAYAVPSNPSFNLTGLKAQYDNYAESFYQNFTYSLQQVQCDADSYSMFSLAVNCTHCEEAYRQWLCAVTIPRCADYSNEATFLQTRNAAQKFLNGSSLPANDPLRNQLASNSSRNPMIDSVIQPGPYNEILPCKDICHDLVRSCPASLSFSCPTGKYLNSSYGWRDPDGGVTCSYPGAAYFLNASWTLHGRVWIGLYMLGMLWACLWAIITV